MKSTTGGKWRISGRSRGPRTAFARIATSLVLATASFSVAGFGATSLASAAGASRHNAAGTSRQHSTAAASRHSTAAASRHSTAGGPLSCDGGTIYSYQRGSDSAAAGSVYALDTSTVGGSSREVAATLVTKVPSGGNANGLGITKGGTAMYAVNQTTSKANSAVIHGYSTSKQTWTTYTGNCSGAKDSFVAGAVNPATGIYYYVTYSAGSASRPGTATVYGFNTNTTTRITGVIATFSLPTGNGTAGNNGDIAFDSAGNMYVLASNGSEVGIGVVKGPIPTTGSSSGAPLTDTLLNRFADRNSYNGIAFDNSGNLYVSGIPGAPAF